MPIELKCGYCGKPFMVTPWKAKEAKYCCKKCQHKALSKINKAKIIGQEVTFNNGDDNLITNYDLYKVISLESGIPMSTIDTVVKLLKRQVQIELGKRKKVRIVDFINFYTKETETTKASNNGKRIIKAKSLEVLTETMPRFNKYVENCITKEVTFTNPDLKNSFELDKMNLQEVINVDK